jgi:hypothetical protein
VSIQYIIEPPNEAELPEAGWPLIIFLHGTTERGSNLKSSQGEGRWLIEAMVEGLAAMWLLRSVRQPRHGIT